VRNRNFDQVRQSISRYSVLVLTRTSAGPAAKALWYIESHFREEISLDRVASVVGVSRYHLTRAFSLATGLSLMQYVRGRRLTEAARLLASGAPNILDVALAAGYNSHEAFTRAFRDQFGMTPEMAREAAELDLEKLLEPLKMSETLLTNVDPPRVENGRTMLIAGIGQRYSSETCSAIPEQWQRFGPHIGHIPSQVDRNAYGVLCNRDEADSIEYIAGVEVSEFRDLPEDWRRLTIPECRYVVFASRDHISTIRQFWATIWNRLLPASQYRIAKAPEFELYPATFDPLTGNGGFEIWLPLEE
jgi:AraC family transcriptional regulator